MYRLSAQPMGTNLLETQQDWNHTGAAGSPETSRPCPDSIPKQRDWGLGQPWPPVRGLIASPRKYSSH